MSKPTAAQLKDEGNDFFRKQDYVGALAKYTEAIALDDNNAILYANRAACQYGLNRYLDAVDDAKMATQIDPGYAKAWSRLAASQDTSRKSAEAWQKALDALPKTYLSPAEQRQKDQYSAGLNAAQTRGKTPKNRCLLVSTSMMAISLGKLRQRCFLNSGKAGLENFSSSAWLISYAYKEFTKGVESINQLKSIPHSQAPGGLSYHGNLMGLTYLTNGLMRDERVFHINHPDWITKYNNQVTFEATTHQAYSGGVETIKELIQKRLKEKGWNDVRPALSVTVRKWIMKGMLESHLGGRPDTGVHFLKRAVDLLEWGRIVWKNVHKDDRGVIFQDNFLRGVRSMHLTMSMNAYSSDPSLNSKFHLEQLKEEAEDLLKEIDIMIASNNLSKEELDPGMVLSFCVYPAAIAHKTIGFYHAQKARYSNGVPACISLMNGVNAYLQAANTYPVDDEFHAFYLSCAMDCMRNAAAVALRAAVPKMMKIWAFSILQRGGRDEKIQAHLRRADEMMKLVAEGKLTLEDPVPF
ncbi:uncharacterized protein F5147DRAFT_693521 [Suillus discolor]|uniref:TPR-like protein n=1 Tax=Suillus discolor TaxID=1912936 RepID=A0A9P7F6R6_9AGAM|nr:uncharacterized protein F5147DRAFT_693521 [Suillus discolor]KAG2108961.1 hypothetical protein F5147DRAFT_693521 [Suillus discolor]